MIKRRGYFVVSMLLLPVVWGLIIDRAIFHLRADRALGRVTNVTSHTSTSSRHGTKTYFKANVEFTHNKAAFSITTPAGNAKGSDQPLDRSELKIGDSVPLIYDSRNPSKGFKDNLAEVWIMPVFAFMAQLALLVASLLEPRRRFSSRKDPDLWALGRS